MAATNRKRSREVASLTDGRPHVVTVCAACHARLHRLRALRIWIPEPLVVLWAEQHPGVPLELQFRAAA